jgi:O-6-methylguanine DNA methyltransferase
MVSEWSGFETSFGTGRIGWSADGTIETRLPGVEGPSVTPNPPAAVRTLAAELVRYFSGMGPLPSVDPEWFGGCSEFERAVYRELLEVPAGDTITYTGLAEAVGRPGAARAVGAAMVRNRWAPMVPCHRVVGRDGRLRGYAGGIEMKRALLEMEAA